jgi:hypothetical protein
MVNAFLGKFKGKYCFRVYLNIPGQGTRILRTRWRSNLITNDGQTLFLARLRDNSVNPPSYIALGAPDIIKAPSLTDKVLQAEKIRNPVKNINIYDTPVFKVVFEADFTSQEVNGVSEIGLFNASNNGILIGRGTFPEPITGMPPGTQITITYTLILKGD